MGEELVPSDRTADWLHVCPSCLLKFLTLGKLAQHWKHIHCDPPSLDLSPKDKEFLHAMRISCDA